MNTHWIRQAWVGVGAVEVGGVILNCILPHWVHSDQINTLPCSYCTLVLGIRSSQEHHGLLGSQYLKHYSWIQKSFWPCILEISCPWSQKPPAYVAISTLMLKVVKSFWNTFFSSPFGFKPRLHSWAPKVDTFEKRKDLKMLTVKHTLTVKCLSGLCGLNMSNKRYFEHFRAFCYFWQFG